MFEKLKQRSEDRRARKAYESAQAKLNVWEEDVDAVEGFLNIAREFEGFEPDEVESPLVTKKGERVFLVGEGAGLAEPRQTPGEWQGGHSGVSIRVAKGVYWRTGRSRGTYKQGEEQQKLIDEGGTAVVTNNRVVYLGLKYNREWAFPKLLGIRHDDDLGVTYMQVSNRQKVSGIVYGTEIAEDVQFRIDLALAIHNDERDALVDALKHRLDELRRERPALPPPPPPPAPS